MCYHILLIAYLKPSGSDNIRAGATRNTMLVHVLMFSELTKKKSLLVTHFLSTCDMTNIKMHNRMNNKLNKKTGCSIRVDWASYHLSVMFFYPWCWNECLTVISNLIDLPQTHLHIMTSRMSMISRGGEK